MTGYNLKFNGVNRLYDAYSWRLNRRAMAAWKSGDVLQGKYLKQLEIEIAEKYKRKYAIGVGSATDGLYFAMKAVGLDKGSTVLCPAFSYVATSGAIKRLGADIHFTDTDKQGNIGDWGIMGLPSAVLYVNMFGNLADYTRLRKYCDQHKIPLIEDAAQSQGAMHGKIPSGALGDVSVFSFDPMKNMPSFGTGGMVLTDSKDVYDTVVSLRRHGLNGKSSYGYNSLIAEDHANQLLLLLSKFDKLQKMRKKVFERYKKNLAHTNFIETQENTQSSYHKLVLLSDRRDELKTYLAQNGIETKVHYTKTLDSKNVGQYPNAENMCAKALSLPIYPHLEMYEVDYICERIRKFNGV
jgi:dTDP-4-amino-4,6-dideoxygalactose transaminase|tara:strand:- start:2652 stop:3710 length:1059 start_codon:yes stop_codon:yes gene_type:complete